MAGPIIVAAASNDYQAVDDANDLLRTITIAKPTGTVDGDRLLAFLFTNVSDTLPDPNPGGWTQITRLSVEATAQDNRPPWDGLQADNEVFDMVLTVYEKVAASEPASYDFEGFTVGDRPLGTIVTTRLGDQDDRFTGWLILQNVNYRQPTVGPDNDFWTADPASGIGTEPTAFEQTIGTTGAAGPGPTTSGVSSNNPGDTTLQVTCWCWSTRVPFADYGSVAGTEYYVQAGSPTTPIPNGSAEWDVSNVGGPDQTVDHFNAVEGDDGLDATVLVPAGSSEASAWFTDSGFNEIGSPVDPIVIGIAARIIPMFSTPDVVTVPPDGGYLDLKARKVKPGVPPYRLTNRMLGSGDGPTG